MVNFLKAVDANIIMQVLGHNYSTCSLDGPQGTRVKSGQGSSPDPTPSLSPAFSVGYHHWPV